MNEIIISEVNVVPIPHQNGLVGFASAVRINQFFIGNIVIYTFPGNSQGFRLVFPNKKLASGIVIRCFFPINRKAEEQVQKIFSVSEDK